MKTVTTDMRHRIRIRIKTDDDKHTHRLNRNGGMPLRLVYILNVICPKVIKTFSFVYYLIVMHGSLYCFQKGYDDLQSIVPTCQQQSEFAVGAQKISKATILQKSRILLHRTTSHWLLCVYMDWQACKIKPFNWITAIGHVLMESQADTFFVCGWVSSHRLHPVSSQRKEEARRRSVHTEEGSHGAEDNENVRQCLTETVFRLDHNWGIEPQLCGRVSEW